MGARLINNPRRTKIGHVEAFPVLHMRSLRKSAMFSEGQRTEGHFRYPGASNAITIIVDLRSEHDLKVLLKVAVARPLETGAGGIRRRLCRQLPQHQ